MKILRNQEVKRTLIILLISMVLFTTLSFVLNPLFGLLSLAFSLFLLLLYFLETRIRYRKMEKLAYEIDRILHSKERIFFKNESKEGEFAILQNEIEKMTVKLREQKEHLEEDKLYLSSSIADISHQLRTPLTSINLYLELLRDKALSYEKRLEILRKLQNLIQRVDWLLTTLLKISKLDAGTLHFQKEKISFESLISKAVEPLQIPIELREQVLEVNVEGFFTGDLEFTSEAITNILKNCMEHTPRRGTLKITARENPLYSEILIEDSGKGIEKEDLPHIFERFYKGKNSGNDSFGVGLALARSILSKENGQVKAENKKEGGALFTVRFYKGAV